MSILMKKINRITTIVSLIIFLAFSVTLIILISTNKKEDSATIGFVNDVPITSGEIMLRLERISSDVFLYFKKKYKLEGLTDNFWNNTYGNEKTIDILRNRLIEDITKIKLEQTLAKQKGLLNDISYQAFLRMHENQNKVRATAKKNNEDVYGVVQYRKLEFYDIYLKNIRIMLKNSMDGNEITYSNQDLITFYENNKDLYYKKPDKLLIERVYCTYQRSNNRSLAIKDFKFIQDMMKEIKLKLGKGLPAKEVVEEYKDSINIKFEEKTIDNAYSMAKNVEWSPIVLAALKMPENSVSDVIDNSFSLNIIKCIKKIPQGHIPWNEAKADVKNRYIDYRYTQIINSYVKNADLKIDGNMLDNIIEQWIVSN